MQLFYNPDISESTNQFFFPKEESKHIVKVLRKSVGDILNITNGNGWLFDAEIINADLKKCLVNINNSKQKPRKDYKLHLAVAPTKMNDRFEWFLEKATEIGIDEITPVFCDHSERRHLKTERMEKVILSAMKQSLKFHLPILNAPAKFKDFIVKDDWNLGLMAHCENSMKMPLSTYLPFHQKMMILIGPEGDFSSQEINQALEQGVKPITLGDNRLRTETAGIVACNYVSLLNEIL